MKILHKLCSHEDRIEFLGRDKMSVLPLDLNIINYKKTETVHIISMKDYNQKCLPCPAAILVC